MRIPVRINEITLLPSVNMASENFEPVYTLIISATAEGYLKKDQVFLGQKAELVFGEEEKINSQTPAEEEK